MKVALLLFTLLAACAPGWSQLSGNPIPSSSTHATSLSGRVLDSANHGVADARVELTDMKTGRVLAAGYTRPSGAFELSPVPFGQFDVVVQKGVSEVRQRVNTDGFEVIELRLRGDSDVAGGKRGATVSAASLSVPNKARREFERAEAAFAKQKMQDAQEHVAKALSMFPKYAQALTLKAIIQLKDNKPQDALADLEEAVKADAGYTLGFVVMASAFNSLQQWDDALRSVERGVSLAPNMWQAHFEMGRALLGKGDFDRALREINKAGQQLTIDYAPLHLVRAHALMGLKNYRDAIQELAQFIEKYPQGVDAERAKATMERMQAFLATAAK